jgi:hypothetical protein
LTPETVGGIRSHRVVLASGAEDTYARASLSGVARRTSPSHLQVAVEAKGTAADDLAIIIEIIR